MLFVRKNKRGLLRQREESLMIANDLQIVSDTILSLIKGVYYKLQAQGELTSKALHEGWND